MLLQSANLQGSATERLNHKSDSMPAQQVMMQVINPDMRECVALKENLRTNQDGLHSEFVRSAEAPSPRQGNSSQESNMSLQRQRMTYSNLKATKSHHARQP